MFPVMNLSSPGLVAAGMIPDLKMVDEMDSVADLRHQMSIHDLHMGRCRIAV